MVKGFSRPLTLHRGSTPMLPSPPRVGPVEPPTGGLDRTVGAFATAPIVATDCLGTQVLFFLGISSGQGIDEDG